MEEISSSSTKVKELMTLRSKITAKLERCELDITDAEYRYLEETDHGNIVKGFEGFLHFRFSAQNRKARVRSKDRIFSRSSLTTPLPEEEEMPFHIQQRTLDALIQMVSGKSERMADEARTTSAVDEKVPIPLPPKRRRNTLNGSIESTPSTPPSAVKIEEVPASVGATAKRASKRRR